MARILLVGYIRELLRERENILRTAGYHPTAPGNWGVAKIRALFEATLFAGLRKAGMTEE